MKKTIKHQAYTIVEKNAIVQQYLIKDKRAYQLVRENDLVDYSVLRSWVLQYRKFGTCIDGEEHIRRKGNHGLKQSNPTRCRMRN